MSIINDALKKAQNQLNQNKSQETSSPMSDSNLPQIQSGGSQNAKPSSDTQAPQIDLSKYIPNREKTNAAPVAGAPAAPGVAHGVVEEVEVVEDIRSGKKGASGPLKTIGGIVILILLIGATIASYYIFWQKTPIEKLQKTINKDINKISKSIPFLSPSKDKKKTAATTHKETKPAPLPPPRVEPIPEAPAVANVEAVPAAAPRETFPAIGLNGIMGSGDRHIALINNQIYEVGDYIEDWEIVDITETTVEFEKDDLSHTLRLQR
jgi:hypothetical protein